MTEPETTVRGTAPPTSAGSGAAFDADSLPDPWAPVSGDAHEAAQPGALLQVVAWAFGSAGPVALLVRQGFNGRAVVVAAIAAAWTVLLAKRPRSAAGLALVAVVGVLAPLVTWSFIGRGPVLVALLGVFVAHAVFVGWSPTRSWPVREVPVAHLAVLPLVLAELTWFRQERLALTTLLLVVALGVVECYHRAPTVSARVDRSVGRALVALVSAVGAAVLFVVVCVVLYLPGLFGRAADLVRRGRPRPTYWAPRTLDAEDVHRDAARPFATALPGERAARQLVGGVVLGLLITAVVVLSIDAPPPAPAVAGGEDEQGDVFERGREVRFSDLAAYQGVPFADALKDEQDVLSNEYLLPSDVGGYDVADFEGEFTNVTGGVRRTIEPPPCESCAPATVWLVGGSSAFGLGQRDEHTIASELVRAAPDQDLSLEVVNLGVPGWTLHQEMQKVDAMLERGAPPPDLVVFYNGYNNVVGTVMDAAVNGIRPDTPALLETETIRRFSEEQLDPSDAGTPQQLGTLAADKYRRDMERARSDLAQQGIATLFVFQPDALASDRQYDAVESIYSVPPEVRRHFDASIDVAAQDLEGDVVNLRHLFDDEPPLFADLVHTNERGAQLSAAALLAELGPRLG
jgi:lysophospholipase L1-like esterase